MYVSIADLLGRPFVDTQGRPVGRLADLVARAASERAPRVVGLLVQCRGENLFLPLAAVPQLASWAPHLVLAAGEAALKPFVRQANDVLLGREILDREVIDLRHRRVVRANDVLLDPVRAWQVVGVDTGAPALLRRLLPRALRRRSRDRPPAHLLPWAELDLLARLAPGGVLAADHRRLAGVAPAELARICAAVPPRQAAALLATLEEARAAATLAQLRRERQVAVLATLDPDRVGRILALMAPAAASDIMGALSSGRPAARPSSATLTRPAACV